MKTLVEQLRTLCGNCILAPQNRNAERLKPYCDACEMKWRAADEIDRLQAELDAKTTTLAYLQKNEDAAANVARQAAANAIRECQRLRKDRDRLQAIVDRLPKTADGVPIYPGMTVFARLRCAVTEVDVPKVGCGGVYAQCYSTRDAAEKARQQP